MFTIQRAWEGVAKATGAVTLFPLGLPTHLQPNAARLGFGSDLTGDQRVPTRKYVFTHDTTDKTLQLVFAVPTADSTVLTADMDTITADSTVQSGGSITFEATNADPGIGPWVTLATLTANGAANNTVPYRFVRVGSTNLGSTGAFRVFIATSV